MQHGNEASFPSSLLIDVSDLLQYLQFHLRPTGIQRVQCEILRHLPAQPGGGALRFVLLDETLHLQAIAPPALAALLDQLQQAPDRAALDAALRGLAGHLSPVVPGAGDVFLTIGAFWTVRGMGALFQRLRAADVRIGLYIHDILSLTEPEYFDEPSRKLFTKGFVEAASFADFALATSDFTRGAVTRFLEERRLTPLPGRAVKLAHELPPSTETAVPDRIAPLLATPYVLCVGTVEVRKNPPYLFNLWRLLARSGRAELPRLVLAGRKGWLVRDLLDQLDACGWLGGRIMLLQDATDDELAALYRHCLLTLFPSFAEGWGLPVGESLAHGKICLASRESAIPEVGGALADYIDPYDLRDGLAALTRYLDDPAARQRREQEIATRFQPRRWPAVAADFLAAVAEQAASDPRAGAPAAIRLPTGQFLPTASEIRDVPLSGLDGGLSAELACLSGWAPPDQFGVRASGPVATLRFGTEAAEGARIHLVLRLAAIDDCQLHLAAEAGGESAVALRNGTETTTALSCRVGPGGLLALRIATEGPTRWRLRGLLYYPTAGGPIATPPPAAPLVAPTPSRLLLGRRPPDPGSEAASLEAFLAGSGDSARWLRLGEATHCYDAPIFASRADSEIFYRRYYNGGRPKLGWAEESVQLRRRRAPYVSTTRFSEGSAFDRSGIAKGAGYFYQPHVTAPWLHKAPDHIAIDQAALDAAPVLDGVTALFFNGNLQNYYHWLVEALVPLDLLMRAAGDALRLVLPKSMDIHARFDHRETLRALGFDRLHTVETRSGLIRLEDAVWVEPDLVEEMPAAVLRRFRDRIDALHASRRGARNKRLLVARRGPTRMIGNLAAVEACLARHGFETVYLEGRTPLDQILLFQEAAFIVAPHGGGLANLVFCAPGTRVIELMPTAEMRPFFWLISEKLGLVHGVQFCPPATGQGFQAPIAVDIAKLDALYHMVAGIWSQE